MACTIHPDTRAGAIVGLAFVDVPITIHSLRSVVVVDAPPGASLTTDVVAGDDGHTFTIHKPGKFGLS